MLRRHYKKCRVNSIPKVRICDSSSVESGAFLTSTVVDCSIRCFCCSSSKNEQKDAKTETMLLTFPAASFYHGYRSSNLSEAFAGGFQLAIRHMLSAVSLKIKEETGEKQSAESQKDTPRVLNSLQSFFLPGEHYQEKVDGGSCCQEASNSSLRPRIVSLAITEKLGNGLQDIQTIATNSSSSSSSTSPLWSMTGHKSFMTFGLQATDILILSQIQGGGEIESRTKKKVIGLFHVKNAPQEWEGSPHHDKVQQKKWEEKKTTETSMKFVPKSAGKLLPLISHAEVEFVNTLVTPLFLPSSFLPSDHHEPQNDQEDVLLIGKIISKNFRIIEDCHVALCVLGFCVQQQLLRLLPTPKNDQQSHASKGNSNDTIFQRGIGEKEKRQSPSSLLNQCIENVDGLLEMLNNIPTPSSSFTADQFHAYSEALMNSIYKPATTSSATCSTKETSSRASTKAGLLLLKNFFPKLCHDKNLPPQRTVTEWEMKGERSFMLHDRELLKLDALLANTKSISKDVLSVLEQDLLGKKTEEEEEKQMKQLREDLKVLGIAGMARKLRAENALARLLRKSGGMAEPGSA